MTADKEVEAMRDQWRLLIAQQFPQSLPDDRREELVEYIMYGEKPHAFVQRLIELDIVGALLRTRDKADFDAIPYYILFWWRTAPDECSGPYSVKHKWLGLRYYAERQVK
ncbi:hypothetical protein [Hyphomonas sp.]|jgi:hypothetical protein|uniref:hypothetical protein n=1 Tax=Hyphomonas sp. TaxID=87 RepID=UPI0037BF9E94